MRIGTRDVGPGNPVLVVAELSCNAAGSLDRAHALIDVAHSAGADAIKLQTFKPAELAASRGGVDVKAMPPWDNRTLLDLYTEAQTPWDWHAPLFHHARNLGMAAISSTFSAEATRFLLDLKVDALKVSAFEWDVRNRLDIPDGIPLICSVRPGADLFQRMADDVALLHCPFGYPPKPEDINIADGISRLWPWCQVSGFSDHSCIEDAAVMAVTVGAEIIEVHVMLDDSEYETPPLDAGHSWRPDGFRGLVKAIRRAEVMR